MSFSFGKLYQWYQVRRIFFLSFIHSYFISIKTETQNIKNKETATKMEEVELKAIIPKMKGHHLKKKK